MPTLTAALRADYQQLFDTCQIKPDSAKAVDRLARQIMANEARYRSVAEPLGVPWYVLGVIHAMEAGLDFDCHLHNGDPLSARTAQVPAGRPRTGEPPFSWEDSACDALALEKYAQWSDWSIPGILFKWESYNGWGYRKHHPEVKSPYLWSATCQYACGKYVKDGLWSATAVSRQIGAAALLRRLAELGATGDATSYTPQPKLADAVAGPRAALRYSPAAVAPGAIELQRFLNTFPGIFLREDGKLGERSSDAFRQVFGFHLHGDPRASA
jgi:lysozyme family protein